MKQLFLLLPALLGSGAAWAQAPTCAALQTENAALKDKVAAYEARLGIGVGGTIITDGDADIKLRFVSCKASKSTHKASLVFLATNSGNPVQMVLSGAGSSNFGTNATLVVDEQGQAYQSEGTFPPVVVGGRSDGSAQLPTGVPVSCTIYLVGLPTSVTRLNSATIAFNKNSTAGYVLCKTGIRNIPVTWVP